MRNVYNTKQGSEQLNFKRRILQKNPPLFNTKRLSHETASLCYTIILTINNSTFYINTRKQVLRPP